jgi:hypothetical protein
MTTTAIARASMLAAALVLAGGAVSAVQAQSAPAPKMNVGDRWVYNVKSGIGISPITYQETREVTAVGGGGFKLKVTGKTADGKDFSRVDDYSGPGTLRSGALCIDQVYRFPTPLPRAAFPLAPGQRSSKWVDVVDDPSGSKGQINYSYRTRSWDKQAVPAGTFDAIRIDANIVLDDSTPFRNATNCEFNYWYSPTVRGTVREHRMAQYIEIGSMQGRFPVLNAYYELASFTPGKP